MKFKSLSILLATVISAASLTACSGQGKYLQQPGTATPGQTTQNLVGVTPKISTNMTTGIQQVQMTSYQQKADNIKSQLMKMNELSDASVAVIGDTALIAYKPGKVAQDVTTTKKLIADKVKKTDNTIKNVAVTDSTGLMTQVNKIYDNIKNNRPASDVNRDFSQLVKKINPVV